MKSFPKHYYLFFFFVGLMLFACAQGEPSNRIIQSKVKSDHDVSIYHKSNEEWKQILDSSVFAVMRLKKWELKGQEIELKMDDKGTFHCTSCNLKLFDTENLIKLGVYPSFSNSLDEAVNKVNLNKQIECYCNRCDGFLGFFDSKTKDYNINSLTLRFYLANNNMKEATFGAGCFWCIEACFKDLKGVQSVVSGYSNGDIKNPTYKEVCTGSTGYAEVARIVYDESLISFDELLEAFWFVHDPTQLNRQGNDIGTQYRSGVYYHSEDQMKIAEAYKARLIAEKVWEEPIVTEIVPVKDFYPAEDYHQNYLELNPENAYCRAIVRPKVDKFRKVFSEKIDK
jgi:peptide-methionine (S)-S-oxide reductase